MNIRFVAIPTDIASRYRQGQPDAFGLSPEYQAASSGTGTPCRHCLQQVPAGKPYLILAYRPFKGLNPYTETGPIFLCADDCAAAGSGFPDKTLTAAHYIVRGYSADERIIYGSGHVVNTFDIPHICDDLLTDPNIAFVHVRSASNNCFLCRVQRARPCFGQKISSGVRGAESPPAIAGHNLHHWAQMTTKRNSF